MRLSWESMRLRQEALGPIPCTPYTRYSGAYLFTTSALWGWRQKDQAGVQACLHLHSELEARLGDMIPYSKTSKQATKAWTGLVQRRPRDLVLSERS